MGTQKEGLKLFCSYRQSAIGVDRQFRASSSEGRITVYGFRIDATARPLAQPECFAVGRSAAILFASSFPSFHQHQPLVQAMVVVLDAIESEKVEFDYGEDDLVEVSQPFIEHGTQSVRSRKSKSSWRLSRRGQWVLRSAAAFIITVIVLGNWIGVKEDKKHNHLFSSIIDGSSSDNGLGVLGVMLRPKKAEKLFL